MSDIAANSVLYGDCRKTLRTLPKGIARCCVTSPPYWGLRDYGHADQLGQEDTPEEYVEALVAVFREVRRLLTSDGTLWLNLGDSYAAASGGAQGKNSHFAGRAAARGGVRITKKSKVVGDLKPKDLVGIPWMVAFALRSDGWFLRSDIIWVKSNWMPSSVHDRPTSSHEHVFQLSKSRTYYYDADAIREPAITTESTRNCRDVWSLPTQPYSGSHYSVMPPALAQRCVLAGSALGDVVLDPFLGSGTVGMVAEANGRRWIGCELVETNRMMIDERTVQAGLLTWSQRGEENV